MKLQSVLWIRIAGLEINKLAGATKTASEVGGCNVEADRKFSKMEKYAKMLVR